MLWVSIGARFLSLTCGRDSESAFPLKTGFPLRYNQYRASSIKYPVSLLYIFCAPIPVYTALQIPETPPFKPSGFLHPSEFFRLSAYVEASANR